MWANGAVGARLVYTEKVAGSSPAPPTRRGSSLVEQSSEKAWVGGSIPLRGTQLRV